MEKKISEQCPDCAGRTIEFRGSGLDMQYRVCPRFAEPGHKSEEQIGEEFRRVRYAVRPSGRFA